MVKYWLMIISLTGLQACSETVTSSSSTTVSNSLKAPAELVSLQQVTIGPPNVNNMWQFKIEYLIRENSLVKEGDVLIRFDGQNLRNNLIGRQSELDAAIKEADKQKIYDTARLQDLMLEMAEAKMNRDKTKRKVEITDASRSDIERKKQQADFAIASERYKQAQQRVQQHKEAMQINQQVQQAKIDNRQVRVDNLNKDMQKLTITSPKSGMVTFISDWEGNKPAVGDTVYMGRSLLNIPSLDKIAVKVEFDEADTAKVALGQAVKVTLDAFPEKPFNGTISDVGKAYRNKSRHNLKIVFDAWVALNDLDNEIMRPGMKARVEVLEETL